MATYDKAYELAAELKRSEEYKEYQKAKAELSANEAALSILRDYRKQELLAQAAMLSGKPLDEKADAEMQRIRKIAQIHGPVQKYIEAERQIIVMLSDVQRILTDSLNLLEE